ncbi:hypothetical protein Tsubulata_003567 [Turnera subulata]|uniref:Small acidic protein-like domain-containing protein n=1 Tax=Turnera subulata TaxID=218843 RepID=A0A9Q0GC15_9ROSI|nr:hypothetical protein Tsubulata_003567 [Turnera subulata]
MDSNSADPSSNLTFRKPSNDVAKRKYRRHSPTSESSSPHGSPKYERSSSPVPTVDPSSGKVSEHHQKRKSYDRELERNSARSHYAKHGDPYRDHDRHSSRHSHGYSKHDDYRGHGKASDEWRHSHSSSDYHRRDEHEPGRSRDSSRSSDRLSHDKKESLGYRSRPKEKELSSSERHRDLSPGRLDSGRKYSDLPYEEKDRDLRRSGRDARDRRSDRTLNYDEARGHRNSSSGRHDEGYRRESYKDDLKELNDQKEKKRGTREPFHDKDHYSGAPVEQNEHKSSLGSDSQEFPTKKIKLLTEDFDDSREVNEKKSSSSKLSQEIASKVGEGHDATASEAVNDLNAAKVAAMKAAELVNKNLVGVGFMSADQKKKLLWGNKKSGTSEEPGRRWDTALFGDRERQEKFNKLMGVKGEVKMELKPDNQDGDIQAVKQKELQMDLEKQYTAGLRRRDGRTVGLGL